jgi:hypothetical protein
MYSVAALYSVMAYLFILPVVGALVNDPYLSIQAEFTDIILSAI